MTRMRSVSRRQYIFQMGLGGAALSSSSAVTMAKQGSGTANQDTPSAPFRRVVTGRDRNGKSMIASDGPVPAAARWTFSAAELAEAPYLRGISGNEIWLFAGVPTDADSGRDPLLGKLPDGDQPPHGGILARIHRFEPGTVYPMHQTQTVDLIIIIAGTMELRVEQGATTVRPGDVIVQNRTRHAWRVVGDGPCVFVAVMFDAAAGLPAE